MVQLPDGTMERRLKMPLNVDPGVHSSFNLDQLVPGTPLTPVPTLPTITEAKTIESVSSRSGAGSGGESKTEVVSSPPNSTEENNNPLPNIPEPIPEEEKESPDGENNNPRTDLPLSTSIPIPKRGPRRNSEGIVSSCSPPSNPTTSPSSIKQGESFMSRTPTKPIPVKPPTTNAAAAGAGSVGARNVGGNIPRNGSAPQFNYSRSIPKNVSVPVFNHMTRKHSFKAVPLGSTNATNRSSKPNLQEGRRNSIKNSMLSFVSSRPKINGEVLISLLSKERERGQSIKDKVKGHYYYYVTSVSFRLFAGGQEEDYNSMWSKQELSDGLIFSTSMKAQSSEPRHIVRPMSRKDIFYSGSIVNLPEYQSQRSINEYRQSILNLPRTATQADALDAEMSPVKAKPSPCPCFGSGPGAFKSALQQMMDLSLLKNPVFMFIAVSNIFGMLGFYIPLVYIIDAAVSKVGQHFFDSL